MEINKDTRDRIYAAANMLFEQAGRAGFPTVDAVRKAAKVSMGDASTAMKEWRRAQTAQAAPVTIQVPETVEQLHRQALAALWQAAQDMANESLRAAQAGWEAERVEADTLNKQLADAYEAQAAELEIASEKITEIERRVNALLTELDQSHQDAALLRAELSSAKAQEMQDAATIDTLRSHLATVTANAAAANETHQEQRNMLVDTRSDLDQMRKEAGQAREEAASLRGQVGAMREQQAAMMEALKLVAKDGGEPG